MLVRRVIFPAGNQTSIKPEIMHVIIHVFLRHLMAAVCLNSCLFSVIRSHSIVCSLGIFITFKPCLILLSVILSLCSFPCSRMP